MILREGASALACPLGELVVLRAPTCFASHLQSVDAFWLPDAPHRTAAEPNFEAKSRFMASSCTCDLDVLASWRPCYFTAISVRVRVFVDDVQNSVAFEKKIRDRWREKNREKNARIAEFEARVAELEQELKNASR